MTFYYQDFDLSYVINLLKVTEKLAITPLFDKNKQEFTGFKYYLIVTLGVIFLGCGISTYGIVVYFFPQFRNTIAVLRLITVIGLSMYNAVTVIIAAVNVKTWNTFMKMFIYLDKKLGYKNCGGSAKYLTLELFLNLLAVLSMCCYDASVWYYNYQWKIFKFCLFKYFNYIHGSLTTILTLHFASAIAGRYKRINNMLIKSNDLHNIFKSLLPKGSTEKLQNLKSIKEVTDYYLLLADLVEMFNTLFGWQVLFLTENIILGLIEFLNNLMLSLDTSQKSADVYHDFRTIFLLISFSILIISYHTLLIVCCEDVNKASRNTLTICYNLQETVDPMSEEKKELIILCDVVSLLKTRTKAAGFYYINRSISSRVFAYLFSYSIVFIQFNKQYGISRDQVRINSTYENSTITL